ncbi:MAG TPA: hypothetical protein VJH37_02310 [Candidatus Nanoarchaeia archaeon]|nr:hypothetical protein [Candidatus Nanoarchaeia archaeon]
MDKKHFAQAIQVLRQNTEKKEFTQSVDIIMNFKGLDPKREDHKVNAFIVLPFSRGKTITTTALVGHELSTKAKAVCNEVVQVEQFKTLEKNKIKKLAETTTFFIAQSTIMPQIAQVFGKILGPRSLMPNPKAGAVIPPTGEVKNVVERLQKTVRVETKNEPVVKAVIGIESMKDEELVENAFAVYNTILHTLPQEKHNIKSVLIKLTMGKPVIVTEEGAHVKIPIVKQRKETPKKQTAAQAPIKEEKTEEAAKPKKDTTEKKEKPKKAPKAKKEASK